jgi:hypothetical protein
VRAECDADNPADVPMADAASDDDMICTGEFCLQLWVGLLDKTTIALYLQIRSQMSLMPVPLVASSGRK